MFGKESSLKNCAALESKLVEYLDGKARPPERHAVEAHLAQCDSCRLRAQEFRALWERARRPPRQFPLLPAFDASPCGPASPLNPRPVAFGTGCHRRGWPLRLRHTHRLIGLAFLDAPHYNESRGVVSQASQVSAESDFGMIRDLPVLDNFDVVSKFDALSGASCSSRPRRHRKRRKKPGNEAAAPIRGLLGRLRGGGTPRCFRVRAKIGHRGAAGKGKLRLPRGRVRRCGRGSPMRCLRRAIQTNCLPRRSSGFRICLPPGRSSFCGTTSASSVCRRNSKRRFASALAGLEPPDARSTAGLARLATGVGADDSRAAEKCPRVPVSALATAACGTAPVHTAAPALASQYERSGPPRPSSTIPPSSRD